MFVYIYIYIYALRPVLRPRLSRAHAAPVGLELGGVNRYSCIYKYIYMYISVDICISI